MCILPSCSGTARAGRPDGHEERENEGDKDDDECTSAALKMLRGYTWPKSTHRLKVRPQIQQKHVADVAGLGAGTPNSGWG